MFNLSVQTASGETLTLTGNEAAYQVIGITGLNPPSAHVNLTDIVGMDGAIFNSAKLNTRNLVITCRINEDTETNRLNLYRYFRTKDPCRVFYSNDSVDVYIDGYVDSVECDYFVQGETAQISIICPYPYFRSVEQITETSRQAVALFEFPFTLNTPVAFSNYDGSEVIDIYNSAEAESGIKSEIYLSDAASEIEFKNTVTGESIVLQYAFEADDAIMINTTKGEKTVWLLRDLTKTNLFPAIQQGSVFPQLTIGKNSFVTLMNGEVTTKVYTVIRFNLNYRGV